MKVGPAAIPLSADDREVERQMVPFNAPAPGLLGVGRTGLAEDVEEVKFRVADRP